MEIGTTLTPSGTPTGDVTEIRLGDPAAHQRYALRVAASDKDKIKPIENVLAVLA